MHSDVKSKLVNALRSGDYKQTRSRLKRADCFCANGVLGDLFVKAFPDKAHWYNDNLIIDAEDFPVNRSSYLPNIVLMWARMSYEEGLIARWNDHGFTFLEIADKLESGDLSC